MKNFYEIFIQIIQFEVIIIIIYYILKHYFYKYIGLKCKYTGLRYFKYKLIRIYKKALNEKKIGCLYKGTKNIKKEFKS